MPISTDELMLDLAGLPAGSDVRLFLPDLDADAVIAEAARRSGSRLLSRVDAHTVRCPLGSAVFVPVPGEEGANLGGLISVILPDGIVKGQKFRVVIRQLSRNRARVEGTFEVFIPVKTKEELLEGDERRLSVLRHIQASIPLADRWRVIMDRNVGEVAARIRGLGVDPDTISPSPDGHGGKNLWAVGVIYHVGEEATYLGLDYTCRQQHTSQSTWTPPQTYALWARIHTAGQWAVQVIYKTGDIVTFDGKSWRALQGGQAIAGAEPPKTPALWQRI